MASVFHYFFLLVQIQAVLCGLIDRISRTPQQSAKNLLSSRNCYFSPTQCFLPRVFDKYVPAQNTSSVIGRRPRRIRPHHHRALAYMTTNIRNKLILQTQAQKKM